MACGGAAANVEGPRQAAAKGVQGAAVATTSPAATAYASESDAVVPIEIDDATWGSRTAPVTIVEFADLECPFCTRAAETIESLKTEYGPDKLRVVFKNLPLPFHPHAHGAAEAARGVYERGGSVAFWGFAKRAFAHHDELGDEAYARWAVDLGVDAGSIARGVAAGQWTERVKKDEELAKSLGVNGTPTFFINGVALIGAQPIDKFRPIVDAELKGAAADVAGGTVVDRVYATRTESNLRKLVAQMHGDDDAPDLKTYRVPLGASPALGPADAPVTIVLFSDFECPYCKRAESTLAQLREKYPSKLRFVWKNEPLPFHPHARPAAELALEARAQKGDAGFWAAHDALFASSPALEDADLDSIARTLGLDAKKTRAAIDAKKHEREIAEDEMTAEDFSAEGTPSFFINGHRVVGAQPLDAFVAVVDAELAVVAELTSKGVRAKDVYDARTKDGVGPQVPERREVAHVAASPTRGSAHGEVTIEEFADFQCPYCKRAEATVDELVKAYPGKIRVSWRNLPLESIHPNARLAAVAAMEAYAQKGAAGFWKMHDALYENQGIDGGLAREALDGYAKAQGLDMNRWAKALDGKVHDASIDADVKTAEDAKIAGTPSFVINGYYVSGAQPLSKLRRIVERALDDKRKPPAKKN